MLYSSCFENWEEAYEVALLNECLYNSHTFARQRLCKNIPAAKNTHARIEELLDMCFQYGPCLIKGK
jgi:hypothetical protein